MKIQDKIGGAVIPDVLSPFGKKITSVEEWEKAREDVKKLLQEEEYGYIPEPPKSFSVEVLNENEKFLAGKTTLTKYRLTAQTESGEASFVFYSVLPKDKKQIPLFVHINFRDAIPDQYQPTEEIIDRGFGIFTVYYNDVTTDNGDFDNGIAKVLVKDRSHPHAPGKLALWAWAIMRVIDYVQTLPCYRPDALAVIGHSRLGKTTLLTAAFDERVKFACANDSGNSGDAVSRITEGERIFNITKNFPYWFCPSYLKYVNNEDALPFDQHFLLALTVPRALVIGTAKNDEWADPAAEYVALSLTDAVYSLYGKRGVSHTETIPDAKTVCDGEDAHFHIRHGNHYLSREDWNAYMDFIDSKI